VVVSGNLWHKVVTNGEKLKNRGKIAMLLLTGEYQHVIDDKSRVLISNKLRSQIDVDEHGSSFYLVLGANGVLCLYPEKYFEQIVQAVAPATSAADEAVSFERMSFALASKVELDSQGRLLINERLRTRAGLTSQITLVGVRDHIEVWNSQNWEQYIADHMAQYQNQMAQARKDVLQKQSQGFPFCDVSQNGFPRKYNPMNGGIADNECE
jgi:MraZ protein